MAVRSLLAESRSAGNEETWNTLVAKFPSEDHAAVFAAAAEAVLASATEGEDRNTPPWRPDDKYVPRCSSTSSASAAPSQAPETTVNDLFIYSPSFTPTSGGRSSEGA